MPDEVCVSFYLEVSPGIPGSTPEHRFQVADRGRSTRSARIGEKRARRGKSWASDKTRKDGCYHTGTVLAQARDVPCTGLRTTGT